MRYRNITDFIFVFLFSAFLFSVNLKAGTCTSISRTNFSANSVLTSSDLNNQFNTVYNQVNALDGGCVSDGTLELAAVDTSDWEVVLNAIKQGCKITYSDASTLSVSKCLISVNGNFVRTTSATTVSFGCTGCSSEAASSDFYVYAKTGSTGSTLNLLISSTSPNNDGYDNSSNKVLGRFYNNGSSDIDQYSIDQWIGNQFVAGNSKKINIGTVSFAATTTDPTKGGSIAVDEVWVSRIEDKALIEIDYEQSSAGSSGSGTYLINMPNGYEIDTTKIDTSATSDTKGAVIGAGKAGNTYTSGSGTQQEAMFAAYDSTTVKMYIESSAFNDLQVINSSSPMNLGSANANYMGYFTVPIKGWKATGE